MMQLEGFRADHACQIAQVSRAGFYRHYAEHEPRQADIAVRDLIQRVLLENRCYGYRRVTAELGHRGVVVNHKRVLRLMRMDNLLAVRKQRFVFTTDSRHTYAVYPNLADRMRLTSINQLWVADITYVRLRETFLYLAMVLDAYSRRVIGWELGEELSADLALGALNRALADRPLGRASCITPTAACSTAARPTSRNSRRTSSSSV
jgi:transposase InsO family protein